MFYKLYKISKLHEINFILWKISENISTNLYKLKKSLKKHGIVYNFCDYNCP